MQAQNIRFNKLIKTGDSLTESGNNLVKMPNGNYLLACNTIKFNALDSTKHYRICIVQCDSAGNLFSKQFVGKKHFSYGVSSTPSTCLISTSDGGYALTGAYYTDTATIPDVQNTILMKLNATGTIQWMQDYPSSWDYALPGKTIIEQEDKGFIVLSGTKRKSDGKVEAVLIRTDSLGKKVWKHQYSPLPSHLYFDPYSMIKLPDKGYLISGTTSLGTDYFIQVTCIDSLGALRWNKKYGGRDSYASLKLLSSSNILLYGKNDWSSFLAELNMNGDTLYQVITPPSGRMDIYRVAFERPDGLILVGNKYKDTPVQIGDHIVGWIKKLDTNKKMLWQRTFYRHNLYDNNFLSAVENPDLGFTISGVSFDSTITVGSADIWLVKTDSFGCDVPGCQLADGIAPLQPGQGASMQLYPNPAATQGPVHVQYLLRKPGQLTVTLTDINGKQLAEIPFYSHATEGSLSMDMSWLKPGIYTLTLQTETGLTHQKLLLQ